MKKFRFLPVVAFVISIAASAFTTQHKAVSKTTTLYNFFAVSGGQVDPNSPLNDEPMTVEDFNQSNPISCPSGNNADCIRAWEPSHTPTSTGAGDYTIRKL